MSFHKLEDRFNDRVGDIYTKYGNPSMLVDPLPPPTPIGKVDAKNDTRSLPVASTLRDATLLQEYLKTPRGKIFLATQTILQGYNTYKETNLYNGLSPLLAKNPFFTLNRHLGDTTQKRGFLQARTIQKLTGDSRSPVEAMTRPEIHLGKSMPTPLLFGMQSKEFRGQPKGLFTVGGTRNALPPTFKSSPTGTGVGSMELLQRISNASIEIKYLEDLGFSPSKPYSLTGPSTDPLQSKFAVSTTGTARSIVNIELLTKRFRELYDRYKQQRVDGTHDTVELLVPNQSGIVASPYFESANSYDLSSMDNSGLVKDEGEQRKSNIQDPYNLGKFGGLTYRPNNGASVLSTLPSQTGPVVQTYSQVDRDSSVFFTKRIPYTSIIQDNPTYNGKKDIISLIIQDSNETNPVPFRAFIKSFVQNIKTEYNEQQYIGRTERFVTYGGAKRTASFVFHVVGFSEEEIENVWVRMNYLTGLAFPKGVSLSGFMVPPLFKLTIGNIYRNQPCYIDTMDHKLIDASESSFDIEHEVPQYVEVTMNVSLIEKTTRFYNSPFYGIVEDIIARQSGSRAEREQAITQPPPSPYRAYRSPTMNFNYALLLPLPR